jgi:hypothetical protein
LYERNFVKLFESKKVELIAVDAAAEVRVLALLRANPFEFKSLESFTNIEFKFAYFRVRGDGECAKLVV